MAGMHKTAGILSVAASVPVVLVAPWYATVAGAALAGSIYAANARRRAAFYRAAARLAGRARMMLIVMAQDRGASASATKSAAVKPSLPVSAPCDDKLFDPSSRAEIVKFWLSIHS